MQHHEKYKLSNGSFDVIPAPNEKGSEEFFGHVLVGEHFTFNGNTYKKRSTRTAELLDSVNVRSCYFSGADLVIIA